MRSLVFDFGKQATRPFGLAASASLPLSHALGIPSQRQPERGIRIVGVGVSVGCLEDARARGGCSTTQVRHAGAGVGCRRGLPPSISLPGCLAAWLPGCLAASLRPC
eukprot:917978-Rhodomonas_salina.1